MTIQEIKALMREKNITQIELSEKSNIPLQTLRKVFSGHTQNPRVDTMQAIERALGIDNQQQKTPDTEFNDDERELIEAYRKVLPSLKGYAKETVMRLAGMKIEEQRERKNG